MQQYRSYPLLFFVLFASGFCPWPNLPSLWAPSMTSWDTQKPSKTQEKVNWLDNSGWSQFGLLCIARSAHGDVTLLFPTMSPFPEWDWSQTAKKHGTCWGSHLTCSTVTATWQHHLHHWAHTWWQASLWQAIGWMLNQWFTSICFSCSCCSSKFGKSFLAAEKTIAWWISTSANVAATPRLLPFLLVARDGRGWNPSRAVQRSLWQPAQPCADMRWMVGRFAVASCQRGVHCSWEIKMTSTSVKACPEKRQVARTKGPALRQIALKPLYPARVSVLHQTWTKGPEGPNQKGHVQPLPRDARQWALVTGQQEPWKTQAQAAWNISDNLESHHIEFHHLSPALLMFSSVETGLRQLLNIYQNHSPHLEAGHRHHCHCFAAFTSVLFYAESWKEMHRLEWVTTIWHQILWHISFQISFFFASLKGDLYHH